MKCHHPLNCNFGHWNWADGEGQADFLILTTKLIMPPRNQTLMLIISLSMSKWEVDEGQEDLLILTTKLVPSSNQTLLLIISPCMLDCKFCLFTSNEQLIETPIVTINHCYYNGIEKNASFLNKEQELFLAVQLIYQRYLSTMQNKGTSLLLRGQQKNV